MERTAIELRKTQDVWRPIYGAGGIGLFAMSLLVLGVPLFVLFFFAIIAFFTWKAFTADSLLDTRRIFEFYLVSNEILRDDRRQWFGFEIDDAIALGRNACSTMPDPPPLVRFALGALMLKKGDRQAAMSQLSTISPGSEQLEIDNYEPSERLRDYARVLRKIERNPAEAPQMSAAVRSLDRMRRHKLEAILASCSSRIESVSTDEYEPVRESLGAVEDPNDGTNERVQRPSISEVLYDIYDSGDGRRST
jgi:hypothetical protein